MAQSSPIHVLLKSFIWRESITQALQCRKAKPKDEVIGCLNEYDEKRKELFTNII
jgi:hypothetical protein